MAASTLLSNPNRHRACTKTAHQRVRIETRWRATSNGNNNSKDPDQGKNKDLHLDIPDLLIENALAESGFAGFQIPVAESLTRSWYWSSREHASLRTVSTLVAPSESIAVPTPESMRRYGLPLESGLAIQDQQPHQATSFGRAMIAGPQFVPWSFESCTDLRPSVPCCLPERPPLQSSIAGRAKPATCAVRQAR